MLFLNSPNMPQLISVEQIDETHRTYALRHALNQERYKARALKFFQEFIDS